VVRTLALQMKSRHSAQLVIDEWQKIGERFFIPGRPITQELRNDTRLIFF
jgi:hypothetical protein